MHIPGWPGRFELLGCQETKTAGPALTLANNNPANANYRFHGALIARSVSPVKIDLRASQGQTVFPG